MITNGHPQGKKLDVVSSFSELAHDVVELSELQAQLIKLDAEATWRRIRTEIALLAAAVSVLLGCVPVVLLAIAEALTEYAGWPRTISVLGAGLIGVFLAVCLGAAAWRKLQQVLTSFDRSREEFRRNLAWVKTGLRKASARRPTPAEEVNVPG